MQNPAPIPQAAIKIGSDLVVIEGNFVIIHAHKEIEDWQVRGFRRQPIFFKGTKYFLYSKAPAAPPFAVDYKLAPWPANDGEASSQSFIYDESFVNERDRILQAEQKHSFLHYALLPLYPFLGFCWSRFKEDKLSTVGFCARSITTASTLLTFCLFLLDGVFVSYLGGGIFTQLAIENIRPFGSSSVLIEVLDITLLASMGLDCVIRYSQVLRGDDFPDGFLEWLIPFRR